MTSWAYKTGQHADRFCRKVLSHKLLGANGHLHAYSTPPGATISAYVLCAMPRNVAPQYQEVERQICKECIRAKMTGFIGQWAGLPIVTDLVSGAVGTGILILVKRGFAKTVAGAVFGGAVGGIIALGAIADAAAIIAGVTKIKDVAARAISGYCGGG